MTLLFKGGEEAYRVQIPAIQVYGRNLIVVVLRTLFVNGHAHSFQAMMSILFEVFRGLRLSGDFDNVLEAKRPSLPVMMSFLKEALVNRIYGGEFLAKMFGYRGPVSTDPEMASKLKALHGLFLFDVCLFLFFVFVFWLEAQSCFSTHVSPPSNEFVHHVQRCMISREVWMICGMSCNSCGDCETDKR